MIIIKKFYLKLLKIATKVAKNGCICCICRKFQKFKNENFKKFVFFVI
jgi:hypothetical protein